MVYMQAAVVTVFGEPPRYQPFEQPIPSETGEYLVDVVAVGLHPRVRSAAAGRHYSNSGTLPMVPGVDGVGRRADGSLVYFVPADDVVGTMAQHAVVDPRRAIDLPAGVDVARIAAGINPAMSSWVALRRRVPLHGGERVLVLGATGNAGTAAVQVAKHLGAGQVVATGRDLARLERLRDLGADAVVPLSDAPALAAAADVDVVLDYLWGPPAAAAMQALLTARGDRARALDWVQIGSVAGADLALPSVLLRQANLRVQGVGQGAVSPRGYLAELPSLVEALEAGRIAITPRPAPLADVETVWTSPERPGERTVLVP